MNLAFWKRRSRLQDAALKHFEAADRPQLTLRERRWHQRRAKILETRAEETTLTLTPQARR